MATKFGYDLLTLPEAFDDRLFRSKRSFQTVIDQPFAGLIPAGRQRMSPSRRVASARVPG